MSNNMNDFVRLGFFQSFINSILQNGGRITKSDAKSLLEFIDKTPGTVGVSVRMDEDIRDSATRLYTSLRKG